MQTSKRTKKTNTSNQWDLGKVDPACPPLVDEFLRDLEEGRGDPWCHRTMVVEGQLLSLDLYDIKHPGSDVSACGLVVSRVLESLSVEAPELRLGVVVWSEDGPVTVIDFRDSPHLLTGLFEGIRGENRMAEQEEVLS